MPARNKSRKTAPWLASGSALYVPDFPDAVNKIGKGCFVRRENQLEAVGVREIAFAMICGRIWEEEKQTNPN